MGKHAIPYTLDIGNISSFDNFVTEVHSELEDWYGGKNLDVLANNAGTALYEFVIDATETQFEVAINIHHKGFSFLPEIPKFCKVG